MDLLVRCWIHFDFIILKLLTRNRASILNYHVKQTSPSKTVINVLIKWYQRFFLMRQYGNILKMQNTALMLSWMIIMGYIFEILKQSKTAQIKQNCTFVVKLQLCIALRLLLLSTMQYSVLMQVCGVGYQQHTQVTCTQD